MRQASQLRSGVHFSVGGSGAGKPMVFQHGLCGDAAQPVQVFPDDIGWRCLTLECRGHGRSDTGPVGNLSIATFADDVADLIETRTLNKPVLGGISMGSAISLRLAVTRPHLMLALVLARPAWLDAPTPQNMQPNALVGKLLRDFDPEEARWRFEVSETAKLLQIFIARKRSKVAHGIDGALSPGFRGACRLILWNRGECPVSKSISESDVALELGDKIGTLARRGAALADAQLNIDYLYGSVGQRGASTRIILKTSDLSRARAVLERVEE